MPSITKDTNLSDLKNAPQHYADKAEQKKDGICASAKKTGQKVIKLVYNAADEVSHATESVTKQIRTSPVQSTAIAFGVGFLVSKLIRR